MLLCADFSADAASPTSWQKIYKAISMTYMLEISSRWRARSP
jgi:hypothetical protein